MNRKTIIIIFESLLIIFFVGILYVPPIKTMITPYQDGWSMIENRALVGFPSTPDNLNEVLEFSKQFEAYYNDHFGFRKKLIYRYQREINKRFGKAGIKTVMQGQNGWLYFTQDFLLEDFQGKRPLSSQELDNWLNEQDQKNKWLHKNGIEYLLFIAPNKQSIYPENMSSYFHTTKGVTRFEQLLEHTQGTLPDYMINLHSVMRQAKQEQLLFKLTDSHWNMKGAHLAFEYVLAQIQQKFPHARFVRNFPFSEQLKDHQGGDLANMMMMADSMHEMLPVLAPRKNCARILPLNLQLHGIGEGSHQRRPNMTGCKSADLTAIVFGDSFSLSLIPFFSENFSRVIYLSKQYDQKNVEEIIQLYKPDIVIEERVERSAF